METEHYFDWAATSPEDPEILREALECAIENFENPSSVHSGGVKARKALESARADCAKAIGVRSDQVFFTSGGTESDQIPLLSLLAKPSASMERRGRIVISAIEHPALREQCENMRKLGYDVATVMPDRNGFISVDAVAEKITADTVFVTVMAVNNETGCVQPVREIAEMIAELSNGKKKPHFHVDCVQAAGKIPMDISSTKIDSAAFSAHKICGPRGIGLLYLAEPQKFKAFLTGGGQEKGVRSGTENLFGAVAFSKALQKHFIDKKKTESESFKGYERQIELTKKFIDSISELKNCRIVPETRGKDGAGNFSPYVVQAAFLGIPGNVMVRALDAKGFAISTGSACSAKKQSRPILDAMKASREIQDSAVRFSFGPLTSEKGMEDLAEAVREVCGDFN